MKTTTFMAWFAAFALSVSFFLVGYLTGAMDTRDVVAENVQIAYATACRQHSELSSQCDRESLSYMASDK